jgi:hypothetical protein
VACTNGLQDRQARRNAWCLPEALQAWPEPFNDHVSITFSMHGEKGRVMLVVLTQHTRMLCHIVEAVTQLCLYKRALFLNHNDLFQTGGKAPHHLGIKRIDDPQTQDPDAQALQRRTVQAHVIQRLAQIRIALAGTDQPDAVVTRVFFDAVEPIGMRIRSHRRMAFVKEPPLHVNGAWRQERHVLDFVERFAVNEDVRNNDLRTVWPDLDNTATVAQVRHQF